MSNQKKISRRAYLKYVGAGAVVVAVAGAGVYYATTPSGPTQATTAAETTAAATTAAATTTVQPTETLTTTIRGLSEVSTHAQAEDYVLRMYAAQQPAGAGINVEITTVPWEQLIPKIMSALMSKDPYFDLFYTSIDYMPMVIDALEPLNAYIDKFGTDMADRNANFGKFIGMWTVNNNFYGFSDESDPVCVHYRKDLFEDPTEMQNFQSKYNRPLAPPTNYQELVETGTFFTRKKGETLAGNTLADDFYGIMLGGKANDWTITLYWACLSEFLEKGGKILDPKTALPAFNDAIGAEAMTKYTDLRLKYNITEPDAASGEHYGLSELWRNGRAAIMMDFPILVAESYHLTNEKPWGQPPTHLVRYSEGYDKSWAMCMNKYGQNKDATYKALEYSSTKDAVKLYVSRGGVPSRFDVLNDPDIAKDRPYFPVMAEVHKKAHMPLAVDPRPISVSWDVMNEVATAISQVLSQQSSVADALKAAYDRAYAVMKKAGYYG